jgi:thiosulfate/3-mercaptopyruvate sulfurtransferase
MYPLIGTAELAGLLEGTRPPTLLDVRWTLSGPSGASLYAAGHLPGAAFADIDTDLAARPGAGGRHPLPDPADLQVALRRLGVHGNRPVVAYDAGDGSIAARAWWLLRWAGHSEVAVLDGGYAAWSAEGRKIVTDPPPKVGGLAEDPFVVRPGQMPVLSADAAAALASGGGILLDARAPERFAGEVEPIDPVAGHVPGARNAPAGGNVGTEGRWLAPAALDERFTALGARPGVAVGAYCGSGVTACSLVLALEVAGVTSAARPAALYAGSWSHWCVDPSRPVATGPD